MCFSLRLFCDSSASGLWHSHVPLPAVGYALFLLLALLLSFFCTCFFPAVGKCSFVLLHVYVPAVGKCSFHPLWVRSSSFFSPVSSNLAIFAQTVGFSWSCVRSTASLPSLRLRTLFHVLRVDWWSQHHTLPSSARCACRGCVSRARLLWVVTPFQATTTLLVSSCVHLT